MADIGLRWNMGFGEVTGTIVYLSRSERQKYGIKTGTKVCLVPPQRLVQDTNSLENLFQGVYHDENGRPHSYLFEESLNGFKSKRRWPAMDAAGRPVVMHIFDPVDATDVRGISVLASAFRNRAAVQPTVDEWRRIKTIGIGLVGLLALGGVSVGAALAWAGEGAVNAVRTWLRIS